MAKKPLPPEHLPDRLKHRVEDAAHNLRKKPWLEKLWGGLHAGAANLVDSVTTFYYSPALWVTGGILAGAVLGAAIGLGLGLALTYIPILQGLAMVISTGEAVTIASVAVPTAITGLAIGGPVGGVKAYHYAQEHDADKMGAEVGDKIARKGRIKATRGRLPEPEQAPDLSFAAEQEVEERDVPQATISERRPAAEDHRNRLVQGRDHAAEHSQATMGL